MKKPPEIQDHELYYAWLQSHQDVTDLIAERGLLPGRIFRVVLGPREFIFDAAGICTGILYRNPDLEQQRDAVEDADGTD